jgi:hypothetical protein
MSEEALAALTALRDSLLSDVPLARTREEHIRVTARAHAADRILALAAYKTGSVTVNGTSEASPGLTETLQAVPPVI